MILRRFIEHVKEQNWTAIFLDFVIVVSGVFIGIQVSNWNAARADRLELSNAIARLVLETQENLDSIATLEKESTASVAAVGAAIDILQACDGNEGNREIVEKGLANAQSTRGMLLRMSALEELTSAPFLLRQQSDTQRKQLSEALFTLKLFMAESKWSEDLPFDERIENNASVAVGPMRRRTFTYHGFQLNHQQRMILLAEPVEIACQNESLIKQLYFWERWQSLIPRNIVPVRAQLDKLREVFDK